jgi:hypothetical protein
LCAVSWQSPFRLRSRHTSGMGSNLYYLQNLSITPASIWNAFADFPLPHNFAEYRFKIGGIFGLRVIRLSQSGGADLLPQHSSEEEASPPSTAKDGQRARTKASTRRAKALPGRAEGHPGVRQKRDFRGTRHGIPPLSMAPGDCHCTDPLDQSLRSRGPFLTHARLASKAWPDECPSRRVPAHICCRGRDRR